MATRRIENRERLEMNDPRIALSFVTSPNHHFPGHPESPERFDGFNRLLQGKLQDYLELVETRSNGADTRAAVQLAHSKDYIVAIEDAMSQAPLFLDYGDTYATPHSYDCALEAVAGTLAMLKPIQDGAATHGFALVRPPGHHANQNQAMGFCLFNNIAIATKTLQESGYAKVAIYDFDVHHGNGTQDIFESDPDVLFISTHQSGIYPGSGYQTEVGKDSGEGSIINIPLPAYTGDQGFMKVFEHIIQPAVDRFNPDFLLISAGFDAHWSDPLANLQLSTNGYFQMTQKIIQLAESNCEGRLGLLLEGGYDPEALADNVEAVLTGLAGRSPPQDRLGPAPIDEPVIDNLIREIRSIHAL